MKVLSRLLQSFFNALGLAVIRRHTFTLLHDPGPLELISRYGISCHSILHIGGHFAEEADTYSKWKISKVVFIEGNPRVFLKMMDHLSNFPKQDGMCVVLSNKSGEANFHLSSNEGASSNILKPGRHLMHKPGVTFDESLELPTKTLDSLGLDPFDLIVLDVQGAEKMVIEGGMETIKKANALWVELNAGGMYQNDANSSEVVAALSEFFVPIYMNMGIHLWGDALFIRKNLTNI